MGAGESRQAFTVPKPALGKKIGSIMGEPKSSSPSSEPPALPVTTPGGVEALLRGGNGTPENEERRRGIPMGQPAPLFGSRAHRRLVQGSLLAADVILACLIVGLVLRVHGRLGWLALALCVVALGFGAWLTCLALWLEEK